MPFRPLLSSAKSQKLEPSIQRKRDRTGQDRTGREKGREYDRSNNKVRDGKPRLLDEITLSGNIIDTTRERPDGERESFTISGRRNSKPSPVSAEYTTDTGRLTLASTLASGYLRIVRQDHDGMEGWRGRTRRRPYVQERIYQVGLPYSVLPYLEGRTGIASNSLQLGQGQLCRQSDLISLPSFTIIVIITTIVFLCFFVFPFQ
ncbi:hypothetical protein LZ30DRAFT_122083 [Colletotrichum cereale]|nr:hypothetical protein LZ30DRAFT_122083 [Colletotrichum cereale]